MCITLGHHLASCGGGCPTDTAAVSSLESAAACSCKRILLEVGIHVGIKEPRFLLQRPKADEEEAPFQLLREGNSEEGSLGNQLVSDCGRLPRGSTGEA